METMLGFRLDFWDHVTFAVLFFSGVIFLGVLIFLIFLLGLPGRIATARNHPEADAVYFMGWVGSWRWCRGFRRSSGPSGLTFDLIATHPA
jgi:Protein of unknown function (DUF3302)